MSKVFEVVMWTASVRRLAYAVSDALDHKPRFHVLTRSDTTLVYVSTQDGSFNEASVSENSGGKSLERLNRDMKDVLFVDDMKFYHPNLLTAPNQKFSPHRNDEWLREILPTILNIAGSEVKDVKEYVMMHGLNKHYKPKEHREPEYSSKRTHRPLTQKEMDDYITKNPKKWKSMTYCQFDSPQIVNRPLDIN